MLLWVVYFWVAVKEPKISYHDMEVIMVAFFKCLNSNPVPGLMAPRSPG